jgi:hypothetical protein
MILRRVIAHVREQTWTAIGIDFLIVVLCMSRRTHRCRPTARVSVLATSERWFLLYPVPPACRQHAAAERSPVIGY